MKSAVCDVVERCGVECSVEWGCRVECGMLSGEMKHVGEGN